jgi:multiple sugar transport system substrate-binding protein
MRGKRQVLTSVLTTCVAAAGLLGGCGGTGPSVVAGDAGVGAQCDGKVDGPVTITVATHATSDPDGQEAPDAPILVYRSLVADFNATVGRVQGITVRLVEFGETSYEKGLARAAAAGAAPDVNEVDAPFVANFAYSGLIRPLGSCVTMPKVGAFLPSVVRNGQYRGKQYTLGAYDGGMGLWVSKKALAKVHARIPTEVSKAWTAQEFTSILKRLKAAGYTAPLNIEWDYPAGEWRPFGFGSTLLSAGGGLMDDDPNWADGTLNSPESVEALTWFQRWAAAGLLDLSVKQGAGDAHFTSGRAAISWVGHWMEREYEQALGNDLALVPLPNFGTGSRVFTGSWSFGISRTAKDVDAAWAFIDFVTSPAAVKRLAASENAIPALTAVYQADPVYQPGGRRHIYTQTLTDSRVGVPRPQSPAYLLARDEFSALFAEVIKGADVKTVLDRAVARIDSDILTHHGYVG